LNPRPAVAELGVVYPPTYYAYNYDTINLIARKAKEMLDRRKIAKIVRHCPKAPKSYLDVGCGDGASCASWSNWRAALRTLRPRIGQARRGALARPRLQRCFLRACGRCRQSSRGGIDLVTMFHVIEHVDNPGTVIGRVCRWLSPVVSLHWKRPTWTVWMRGLPAHLLGWLPHPRHWNLFTPAAISRLLKDNGLEVLATVFQTGHSSGCTPCTTQCAMKAHRGHVPARGLTHEKPRGLAGFTAFDLLRGTLGSKTQLCS